MTASSSPSVADLAIDALRQTGITQLFCIPGVQNDDFFDRLVDARDIQPIVTRHEQGAAYMAMGAAQVTGEPAAFCVVPGPGMLNAGAALTSAYWGQARVFALIGQIASGLMGFGGGALHELEDQTAILRQLTKHAVSITDPADAVPLMQSALDSLHSGIPRPVSVEVPVDNWSAPIDGGLTAPAITMPGPDPADITAAAQRLAEAKNPLIVVGSGAYGASAEVQALAELLQAPVTTRRAGHGVVPTAHPLFVPLTVAHRLWADADVVLGIGTRLEWPLGTWGYDDDLTLIQVNVDADEVNRYGITDVSIHSDAQPAIAALVDELGPLDRPSRVEELDAHRAWFEEETAHLVPQRSYTAAIRDVMPEDGAIVEDVTQIGFASHLFYDHRRPRSFLTSGPAGTLGAGAAVAIGAAAASDGPVVGIVGDGGYLFTATELATAAQYNIPVTILLFNNNSYGNVRRIQQVRFGADRTIASTLQNPDFAKLSEAFGVAHWHADSPETLRPALAAAIATDGPCVVEVSVDPMPNPWPYLRMPQIRGVAG